MTNAGTFLEVAFSLSLNNHLTEAKLSERNYTIKYKLLQ